MSRLTPGVSVVIPTFNRSILLCQVLPSYLTSPSVAEVIVVDDAGTDDTEGRIAALARDEPRLRYLRNEHNLGAPATRNRGALASCGAWILEAEDDLALGEGCIETLLAHAHATGADIIAGRRVWVRLGEDEEQALERANLNRRPLFNEWLMDFNSHAITERDLESPLLYATMLIRREVFDHVRYHEPFGGQSTWREESDFQLKALACNYRLVFCPHAVTYHYSRASQSFGKNRLKATAVYAYRVYRNNLMFLQRNQGYLRANYPNSLLLGSAELSALMYGAYRTAWLLAAEVLRFWRARKYGAYSWK